MTIYTAAALKERMQPLFAACQDIDLDLAAVTEFDSAGLQLLLLAKREATAAGKELRLLNHSHAVLEVLELCNLAAYFGDPVVLTPGRETSRNIGS